jgi:dTDP-4-dehydrorhamnose 3,5-epimerase
MEFIPLPLPGLVLIRNIIHKDNRGLFIKIYNRDIFRLNGIQFVAQEEFYTISRANVLRGMHFQVPPADYGKLVHCVRGSVYDVTLDIRKGSPTYGQCWSRRLDDTGREAIFIPSGFAHGFYSLTPDATLSYSLSKGYEPSCDCGILWDSFGHVWPCRDPILSERDRGLVAFDDFDTPFVNP